MIHKKIFNILSIPIRGVLFWLASRIKISFSQKTIHIVRMDIIGDSVLFSAILPYFRKIYPEYKIVLIIDKVVEELTLWLNERGILGLENINYVDSIMAIDGREYNRNFFYYYTMLKKIRMSCPEIVIQPTFSRTKKSDEIVLISREAKKIGYQGDLFNITMANKMKNDARYDRLIKNPVSLLEPDRNKHFLNELAGFEILSSGIPKWQIPENLMAGAKNQLELLGINLSKPLVAICPASSRKIKNWPTEHFISLIVKLSQYAPGLQFILIGGPMEKEVGFYIQRSVGIDNVYTICGQVTLPELAGVLSLVKLYIGNDTGAMHMACAVGISAIGIMSGENGNRFFPYPASRQGAYNTAVFSKTGGVGAKNVIVEDVFDEAVKILNKINE